MVGGGVPYEHKTRTLYGNVLIFGKGVWSSKVSRFGDLGNLGEINVSLGSSGENALQSLYPLQVGKSVEYSIIESASQNSNSSWEYDDEWNLKTTVREVQTVNIAGQDFSTILIHTTGNSDLGRQFDQKQWYEPNLGLVVKSERTWSGDKTDWAGPGTQSGSTEKYELHEVRFPDRSIVLGK